jgi:uncharacterized protein (DUF2141 family)
MKTARQVVLGLMCGALIVRASAAEADPPAPADAGAGKSAPVADAGAARKATPAPSASVPARPMTRLTVRADGLRNDRGVVFVAIFDSQRGFDDKKPVRGNHARPANRSAVVVFDDLPAGRYVVSFIHDENENKKLDTNFLGIPTEGFGFSRNAMGTFGPPGFDDAAVNLPPVASTVVMRARYYL